MSAHSAVVGGSSAGRLLNCPGSHQAIAALPPVAAITSEYAEHGTAMHEVMATLMRERTTVDTHSQMRRRARALVGQRFHDRDLSPEDCDTLIIPAIDALEELERRYQGGHFRVARVEARLEFPGVAGAFGTIDLLLTNDRYVLHVDWKFGAGVGVRAIAPAPDGAGDLVNPQLLFYAVAGETGIAMAELQMRGGI